MKAGRELDALVAEKVMGCKVLNAKTAAPDCGCPPSDEYSNRPHSSNKLGDDRHLQRYTTDMAAAWEIVRHMNMKCDWLFSVRQRKSGAWRAMFFTPDVDGPYFKSIRETMPHAICLAALKAVESS